MQRTKRGPRSKTTDAGQRFEKAVLNWGNSLNEFYIKLSEALKDTKPGTIENKISRFINGHDSFPARYIYETERILNVRIADIIDGTHNHPAGQRGLYEIGTYGNYQDFEWLAKQTDGSVEVIRSYDEWSKSIFDYVYEAENLEGLKYLVDHNYYDIYGPGSFTAYSYHKGSEEDHALILLRMLAKDDNPEKTFVTLFDSRERVSFPTLNSIFGNETVLRTILSSKKLLEIVGREPDFVPESTLNGPKRVTPKEYQAVCASSWLTPLLCFSLAHEDEYLNEALYLGKRSLEIANLALTSIGSNINLLGGPEESIRTEGGHIILGHNYVIGIIGEPKTDDVIKNVELSSLVNQITSVIGSFRSLAKIQTPVKVNGKLHLPRADQNPIYQTFIKSSKGRNYLLQISDNNDGDSHNYVFDAPKGHEPHSAFTLGQWKQVGKALHSIHEIETGQNGKSFCHGRFCYPNFFVTENGDIEVIAGYHNVYIGNPEEDVFAVAILAFKNDFINVQSKQEAIEAFLKGYGYPGEGFLEKLWAYLISLAKNENNLNEIQYLMGLAAAVLRVIKTREHFANQQDD